MASVGPRDYCLSSKASSNSYFSLQYIQAYYALHNDCLQECHIRRDIKHATSGHSQICQAIEHETSRARSCHIMPTPTSALSFPSLRAQRDHASTTSS